MRRPAILWAGLMIVASALAFNLVGDALRDLFDPREYRT